MLTETNAKLIYSRVVMQDALELIGAARRQTHAGIREHQLIEAGELLTRAIDETGDCPVFSLRQAD